MKIFNQVFLLIVCIGCFLQNHAQAKKDSFFTVQFYGDVTATYDYPPNFSPRNKTIVIVYALPNGNTIEQTMGKKLSPGDDWHFDIQHIRAQTKFIRKELASRNIVVIYLGNQYKSWPSWKQKHADYLSKAFHLLDSLYSIVKGKRKELYLNGHSGGGSLIFSFIKAVDKIPAYIKRIAFLDSDYNYDSSYYPKFKDWLSHVKEARLTVFAYNDSVALYNGKPVVSPTGGTWYRSHLMMQDLSQGFAFFQTRNDSILSFESANKKIGFFFKNNPDRGIYHTQQVELNGFIHSILFGTQKESKKYKYYGPRVYSDLIE